MFSVGWYITNLITSHHCVSQEFAAHEDTDDDVHVSDDAEDDDVSDIAAAPAQGENTRTSTTHTSAPHTHTHIDTRSS